MLNRDESRLRAFDKLLADVDNGRNRPSISECAIANASVFGCLSTDLVSHIIKKLLKVSSRYNGLQRKVKVQQSIVNVISLCHTSTFFYKSFLDSGDLLRLEVGAMRCSEAPPRRMSFSQTPFLHQLMLEARRPHASQCNLTFLQCTC